MRRRVLVRLVAQVEFTTDSDPGHVRGDITNDPMNPPIGRGGAQNVMLRPQLVTLSHDDCNMACRTATGTDKGARQS